MEETPGISVQHWQLPLGQWDPSQWLLKCRVAG